MSTIYKCQMNERPTGWKYPLPTRKWTAYGQLLGDGTGGSQTIYIPRPFDYGAASLEAICIQSSAVPNKTELRYYPGTVTAGGADLLTFPYTGSVLTAVYYDYLPSITDPAILEHLASSTEIKLLGLDYFVTVVQPNVNAVQFYVTALGWYWDAVHPPENQEPVHPKWGMAPPPR